MKTSLSSLLMNNSGLLQQKICDNSTNWIMFEIKLNVHVFSKT